MSGAVFDTEQLLDELADLDPSAVVLPPAAAVSGARSLMQAVYSEHAVRVRPRKTGRSLELVALSDPWPVGVLGSYAGGWTLSTWVRVDGQWRPAPELDLVGPVTAHLLAEALATHLTDGA